MTARNKTTRGQRRNRNGKPPKPHHIVGDEKPELVQSAQSAALHHASTSTLTKPDGAVPVLQSVQQHSLAETLSTAQGNRFLGGYLASLGQSQTGAIIQTAPGPRQQLQSKYKIKIEKGNKDWSASDLKDLKWALAQLTKTEAAALNGYRIIRWSTPTARKKVDKTYKPQNVEECGLHEADLKKNSYKISMYDKCFDKSTTMKGVAVGRFHILHEIGHAMEIAEQARTWKKYKKLSDRFNAKVDAYNAKPSPAKKAKLLKLKKKLLKAEKKYLATVGRTLKEFKKLTAGKKALTTYSKTNLQEAFAEAFALYKIDAKGIRKSNKKLAKYFKKQGHMK